MINPRIQETEHRAN